MEAPSVNKLYTTIEKNPDIKLIGVGANDDIYYVDYFIKEFKARFPLFPDEDRIVHKQVGEPATPYFIVIRLKEDGTKEIFYTMLGAVKDPDKFLETVRAKSGLK